MKKFTKKQWWIAGLLVIVAIIGIFIYQIVTTPRNIGPKLEYIGTYNAGCEWWEMPFYLGWCAGPSNAYYFATDMSENEIQNYFKNAAPSQNENKTTGSSTNYAFKELDFHLKNGGVFAFYYYDNTQAVIDELDLHKTTKNHIISISADDYQKAKSAY